MNETRIEHTKTRCQLETQDAYAAKHVLKKNIPGLHLTRYYNTDKTTLFLVRFITTRFLCVLDQLVPRSYYHVNR